MPYFNKTNKKRSFSFIKMEGCGNDYIFIDTRQTPLDVAFSECEIQKICDRHTGVGSDGVIIITPSNRASLFMNMWNADGFPSAMCGNALRCLALWEYYCSGTNEFFIETSVGLHQANVISCLEEKNIQLQIQMPSPIFAVKEIPFNTIYAKKKEKLISYGLSVHGFGIQEVYVLSMGNPHCILFVDDVKTAPVEALGAELEKHPAFPERTNVGFVSTNKNSIRVRTYERGSQETLACGSGACAAHVVSVLTKKSATKQRVILPGGELEIAWEGGFEKKAPVIMTGPARLVYEGRYYI